MTNVKYTPDIISDFPAGVLVVGGIDSIGKIQPGVKSEGNAQSLDTLIDCISQLNGHFSPEAKPWYFGMAKAAVNYNSSSIVSSGEGKDVIYTKKVEIKPNLQNPILVFQYPSVISFENAIQIAKIYSHYSNMDLLSLCDYSADFKTFGVNIKAVLGDYYKKFSDMHPNYQEHLNQLLKRVGISAKQIFEDIPLNKIFKDVLSEEEIGILLKTLGLNYQQKHKPRF